MTGIGVFDKRAEFFKRYFEMGLSFSDYISTGNPRQLESWQRYASIAALSSAQKELIASFKRRINVLVMSGVWCGDCMRQCPMIHAISECSENITVRYIDNQANPELRDELRVLGGARVPIAVFLSEDFFEVTRSVDRTLSVYRKKAVSELGPACDTGLLPPSGKELETEISEWIDKFEQVHIMLRLSPFLRERHSD